jgi:YidC/Oxa1 family membrane protein insertase
MKTNEKTSKFFKSFLIWFAVFYLVLLGIEKFWGKDEVETITPENAEIVLERTKKSVVIGNLVFFKIENKLDKTIDFISPCEDQENLKVLRVVNDQTVAISNDGFSHCNGKRVDPFSVEPGAKYQFSLRDFNLDFFSEEGAYQLEMKFQAGEETISTTSNTVKLKDAGAFRLLFRAIVSKPLFNLLVFLTRILPTHSFGWAIVIMTLIVRLALFLPNQKAMKSQRELQKLQPKLADLKEKHKGNQQMIATETMKLYKTHKINPMSSCLPMLFQMPFLIGIYYIVREGLSPHLDYLLYSAQGNLDLSMVDAQFFGLNLDLIPVMPTSIILAVLVGGAQWGAVKLSLVAKKRKEKKSDKLVVKKEGVAGQMDQMNKVMLWVMPAMIAYFATTFPAGVSIYWLTSTVFGIFQQKLVNHQLDKPQVVKKV